MNFQEKLKRLTEGKKRSEVARRAKLSPTVVSNYINRGSIPRADIAAKIARALNVTVEWLVDDEQGLPPPVGSLLTTVADDDLLSEVARRYANLARSLWHDLRQAETIDWEKLAPAALRVPVNEELTPELAEAVRLGTSIRYGYYRLDQMTIDRIFWRYKDELSLGNVPAIELAPKKLDERARQLFEARPAVAAMEGYGYIRFNFEQSSDDLATAEMNRERALQNLRIY